jgi:hypothetical protein
MAVEFNISVPLCQIEIGFYLEMCGSNPGCGTGSPDCNSSWFSTILEVAGLNFFRDIAIFIL